jgi:hypothetical protein
MIESPWDEIILALSILQLIISIVRLLGYYLECGVLRVKRIFTTDDDYYKVSRFLSLHRSLPRFLPLSRSHRCRGRNAEGQQKSCEQKKGEAIAAEARGNSRSEKEPKRAQPACQKEREPSQANTERQTLTLLRAHVMVARPLSRLRRSSTAGPCTTSSSLGSSFQTATSSSSPSTWPSTLSPWSLPLTPSLVHSLHGGGG